MSWNLFGAATWYHVDKNKIQNDELVDELESGYGYNEDDFYLLGDTIDALKDFYGGNCFGDAVDYDSAEFDNNELEHILMDTIGYHPHYLVFSKSCHWNGVSGYGIFENILDTVRRNHDITIMVESFIDDRGLAGMESSHDVPVSSPIYIIGISEDEHERLEDADFSEIEHFVKEIFQ